MSPVPPEVARRLSVGDRETLLLHLRKATLGDRLHCVLDCPGKDCGKKMDVRLTVTDLLVAPQAQAPPPLHQGAFDTDEGLVHAWFRVPTGEDQEATASVALADPAGAVALMAKRCLDVPQEEGFLPSDRWGPRALADLSARLAELDPQAEITLDLQCPECKTEFGALFDPGPFFVAEVAGRAADLYREVHLLALHYHWSPSEILAMPREKRRIFLDLLAEALTGEARA